MPSNQAAWTRLGLFALITSAFAQPAPPRLTLRVAAENVVPGAWAQIKVYSDTPVLIGQGVLALDLDPQIFGSIAGIAAFSASGDAIGMGFVSGTHVEAAFHSTSGGIGQLPDVPVFIVRAPVLSNPPQYGFVSLSLPAAPPLYPLPHGSQYPDAAWTDAAGNAYQVTLLSGTIARFGTLSVTNIEPGAGLRPAGTVLHIDGTGFDPSVKVTADGLAIRSVAYVSPTRIEITTDGARELSGVRFLLSNANNEQVDFFAAPASAVTALEPDGKTQLPGNMHVMLPLTEMLSSQSGYASGARNLIVLNPSGTPASLLIREVDFGGTPISGRTITVPAGAVGFVSQTDSRNTIFIDAGSPLRMAVYYSNNSGVGLVSAPTRDTPPPALQLYVNPSEIVAYDQIGGPAPPAQTLYATYVHGTQDVTVQADGGSWLQVTTQKNASSATLGVAFNPSGLAPGTYTGNIIITPVVPSSLQGFVAESSTVKVTLNVSTAPTISIFQHHTTGSGTSVDPVSIDVSSNGSPAAFTVKTSDGGLNWLSTDMTSDTTPATVSIRGNAGNLPNGIYRGQLTVQGPSNQVTVDVGLYIYPLPVTTGPLQVTPASLSVVREIGASGPATAPSLTFGPLTSALTIKVATTDGGNWLTAQNFSAPQNPSGIVPVNIDASKLPAGTYHGTVTGTAANGSAQAAITLMVLPKAAGSLTVTPLALIFNTVAGVESPTQTLTVDSSLGPVLFSLDQGLDQLTIASLSPTQPDSGNGDYLTPVRINFAALGKTPGAYRGTMVLTTSTGEVEVPVTVNVSAAPDAPPVISSIVNAASQLPGPLAPGEIVTIRGIGVGSSIIGLQLDSNGRVLTGAAPDSRVEFNGQPAPVVYGSADQWNVVVPYEVEGSASVTVQVFSDGVLSEKWTLPVAPSVPGLFTIGSTGIGHGAVLNQDNTVNSPANPAAQGTIIQIFATGGGQIVPAGVTGSVTPTSGSGRTEFPVKVTVAGTDAPVVFAGPVPGLVSGMLQVNAVVPPISFPGTALPLTISVGDAVSQPGVTIAVQ